MQLSACDILKAGMMHGFRGKAESAGCEEEDKNDGSACLRKITISGGYDEGVPPVSIPNTEVKPFSADGT